MTATSFKTVSWFDEDPLFTDKLNAMANNDQWLFENMGKLRYNSYGVNREKGIKILAGRGIVNASASYRAVTTVNFGTFFSAGCNPIVVASPTTNSNSNVMVVVSGIGSAPRPDSRGFELVVSVHENSARYNKIKAAIEIPYIAVGW